MIPILPCNPKANYLAHKAEIDMAIARVLESGSYILGKEVEAFENEFSAYIGVRYGIGVGSGTEAIHLALRACGVGSGDVVITVSHTAVATVAAIELCGATPLLVDIDPITFNMSPASLEECIKKHSSARLKAIIPVHLYGHPADMPAILEIAKQYELYVIEDCSQSHGAAINEKKTGTFGDIAAFSFYPTKNLGAIGDGGFVATNNEELSKKVRLLREYGWKNRYISEIPGTNSRLDEIQAAILLVKLQYLNEDTEKRLSIAMKYDEILAGTILCLPTYLPCYKHCYHQYVVRAKRRDELRKFLQDNGISTLIHYPIPIHMQPAYRDRLRAQDSLVETEIAAKEILSLPIYSELGLDEVERVAQTICSCMNI